MRSEKRRTLTMTTAMQCEGTGVTQDRKPWETDLGRDPKDKYESKPIKDQSMQLLLELDSAARAVSVGGMRLPKFTMPILLRIRASLLGQSHGL